MRTTLPHHLLFSFTFFARLRPPPHSGRTQNPRLKMNMRSVLPNGTVTSKFFHNWPWARLWTGPELVLFGHDADRGLQEYDNALGIDTGCVYGGRLTACILPERRLVSVAAKKEYFKFRRKRF